MKYYKYVLTPKTVTDFSFSMDCMVGEKQVKLHSSSTALLKKVDGTGYLMNLRMVNYRIERNSGYYLDCGDHIITNNKYLETDNDFNVTFEKVFDVEFENKRYLGVEDVRIFYSDEDESKLVYIGTSQHKNEKIGMLIGDYDPHNTSVLKKQEVVPAWDSWCEKNWAYFKYQGETRLVYKWHPLEVGKIDKETNVMSIVNTITNTPKIFSHTRGSTCGFAFKDEIWFVLHLVSYESPRHYYHIFAVFDKEMNFLRHSAPFKFQGEPIEYCLGLVVEEERVICTFSEWDGSSKLVVYDKSYVDDLVKYT